MTGTNPYAPPGVETRTVDPDRRGGVFGLRIAGAVVLLLFGLWSLLGGGCSVVAGVTSRGIADSLSEGMADELAEDTEAARSLRESRSKLDSMWFGLVVTGSVSALAGLLANIAGMLLIFNRGKLLAVAAGGLGIAGEVLFLLLVTFHVVGLVKAVAFAFAGVAAMVGVRRA